MLLNESEAWGVVIVSIEALIINIKSHAVSDMLMSLESAITRKINLRCCLTQQLLHLSLNMK